MLFTVAEASKVFGVSRVTIYSKIKNGGLSQRSDKKIDQAEMIRVFGEPKAESKAVNSKVNVSGSNELQLENVKLTEQNKALSDALIDAKERIKRAEDRADRMEELLYKKEQRLIEDKSTKRGLISRFFN